eukprot:g3210.t1
MDSRRAVLLQILLSIEPENGKSKKEKNAKENKTRDCGQRTKSSHTSSFTCETAKATVVQETAWCSLNASDLSHFSLGHPNPDECYKFIKENTHLRIVKGVVRKKLAKLRHLVLPETISPAYLAALFPKIVSLFDPQTVLYYGDQTDWKISCYLEVMNGNEPCPNPNIALREHCWDLLEACSMLFLKWYRQQKACNVDGQKPKQYAVKRQMTFITRYTATPGEDYLKKHVDGAGKVDGSIVLSLPTDETFEGGGLTFWDGSAIPSKQQVIFYPSSQVGGDMVFIDRACWHKGEPITKGKRWALVIFFTTEEL